MGRGFQTDHRPHSTLAAWMSLNRMSESTIAATNPPSLVVSCNPSDRLEVSVVGAPYRDGARVSSDDIAAAFLQRGLASLSGYDGAFGIVVKDPQRKLTHAVTDRFNVVPLYVAEGAGREMSIGSHPDSLARAVGKGTDFDLVTMAQALRMWYATFPHTYYQGIRELEPATIHTWDETGYYSARPYWEPEFRGEPSGGIAELVEQLAQAIREGVQRRVLGAENPGLLLSAGADSRGLLFSAAAVKPIRCYTFYDEPNAELRIAGRLAASAQQEHVALQRDRNYYARIAIESTRAMAGMWNLLDGHALGFKDRFEADRIDLLLSGDFADLLFKGNSLNIGYKKLLGKNLTIKTLGGFSTNWRKSIKVGDQWVGLIRSRVEAQYAGIDTNNLDEKGWWEVAHRRVGVLSRTSAVGGPISLQRRLNWDTFMADRAMCDVYERLTTDMRVNGTLWERAIKLLTPNRARNIPNNNWGARVGASNFEKTTRFLYGVAYRKIRKRDVDGTPLNSGVTRGSWPDFAYFLRHSEMITELWAHRTPEVTDILNNLMGMDLTNPNNGDRVRRFGMGFGRLLTLKLWLEDRFGNGASTDHSVS